MPKPTAAAVLALAVCVALSAFAQPSAPIIKTQNGQVQGVVGRQVFIFKGIPFAAPPVGDLRWRKPQPAPPWQGTRKAESFGNACIQAPGLSAANGGDPGPLSEDCLYLNIWTPKLDPAAKLPVMTDAVLALGSLPKVDVRSRNILKRLQSDKKTKNGVVHFVLPREIGKVEIVDDVPERAVLSAVDELRRVSGGR